MSIVEQQVRIAFNTDVSPLTRVVNHVSRMERGFNSLNRGIDNNSRSLSRNSARLRRYSDQGLANIQAGLVQLSTYMMLFNQRLDNMFEKATNRFSGVDEALTQLRITMGLTGDRSIEALNGITPKDAVLSQYEGLAENIAELARTTQFTNKELAILANEFIKSGMSAEQTKGLTKYAQRLSAASAGSVDLATAGEVVKNSIYAFGRQVDEIPITLDRMLKASQTLNMSLPDVAEGFKSLSGSLSYLDNSKGDVDAFFFTLLAGYRSMGKSPREAADAIRQSVTSMISLYSRLDKTFLRSVDGVKNLSDLQKVYTSRTVRNEGRRALLNMLGLTNADSAVQQEATRLSRMFQTKITDEITEYAMDSIAKKMVEGGKKGKVSPEDLLRFLERAETNLKSIGKSETGVMATIQKAFGKQSVPIMMKALRNVATDVDGFIGKMNEVSDSYGRLKGASEESLKSLTSRLKLAESAEDALMIAIIKEDAVAKGALDTYTSLVNATTNFINNNKEVAQSIAGLGRALQYTSEILTHVGFALVAMATFSIGASYAFGGVALSTLSLGRIMAGFYSIFLAPTLLILIKIGAALGLVSLAFVGFIRYVTGASSVSEGMTKIFDKLNEKIKIFSGYMSLYTEGMSFSSEEMKKHVKISEEVYKVNQDRLIAVLKLQRAQKQGTSDHLIDARSSKVDEFTTKLTELENQRQKFLKTFGVDSLTALKNLDEKSRDSIMSTAENTISTLKTFSAFVGGFIQPLGMALYITFETIGLVAKAITYPFFLVAKLFGWMGDSGDFAASAIGFLIGGFISLKLITIGLFGSFTFLREKVISAFAAFFRLREGLIQLQTQKIINNNLERQGATYTDASRASMEKKLAVLSILNGKLQEATSIYRALNAQLLVNARTQLGAYTTTPIAPPRYTLGGGIINPIGPARDLANEAFYRQANVNRGLRAHESVRDSMGGVGNATQLTTRYLERFNNTANQVSMGAIGLSSVLMLLNQTTGIGGEGLATFSNWAMVLASVIPVLTSVMGLFSMGLGGMIATLWGFLGPLLLIGAVAAGLYYLFKPSSASANTLGGTRSSGETLSPSKATSASGSTSGVMPSSINVPRAASMPSAMGSRAEPSSSISAREVHINIHEKVQDGEDFARMVKRVIKEDRMNVIS